MKNYSKAFVGKGVQNEKLENIVRVTLLVEEMEKFYHEFNGKMYLTFELAKLQAPDKFNKTHTAYVVVKEEVDEKPAPVKPLQQKGNLKKVRERKI
jgi:hypothetical protein